MLASFFLSLCLYRSYFDFDNGVMVIEFNGSLIHPILCYASCL